MGWIQLTLKICHEWNDLESIPRGDRSGTPFTVAVVALCNERT